MAIQRLKIDGYGQIELNKAPFRRSGRIEAQCKIADNLEFVENGMVLLIDRANRVCKAQTSMTGDDLYGLNYTTEHMYDERACALKDFKLDKGTFLPRLAIVGPGDSWTTNCLAYDTTDFADDETFKNGVTPGMYAIPSSNGALVVKKSKPTAGAGVQLFAKVVKVTTMPDGQFALQFDAI